MMPAAVSGVSERIAQIEARFAPPAAPPSFERELSDATTSPATREEALPAGAPGAVGAEVMQASATGQATDLPGSPDWASRLPEAGQRWAPAITKAAHDAGIEPQLLAALVQAESNFQPDARSHAGAIGLAQLMPGTAAGLGVDAHDPEDNLAGGARYLRAQLDRFGAVELALAAYNAGPNRVAQAGGVPRIAETQAYVSRVHDNYRALR